MIDRVCEEEIGELQELLDLWNSFSRLSKDVRKRGEIDDIAENKFSEVREKIAGRYPALMERLEICRGDRDETAQLLARVPSAGAVVRLQEVKWRKFEEMQAHVEVGLRGLLGLLESRRRVLAEVGRTRIVLRKVITSWAFKLVCLAAAVILFFIVLDRMV